MLVSYSPLKVELFGIAPVSADRFEIKSNGPGLAGVDRFEQSELRAVGLEFALLVEGRPDLRVLSTRAGDGLAVTAERSGCGGDQAAALHEGGDNGLGCKPHWPPGGAGHLGHIAAAVLFRMGRFHGRLIRKGRCPGFPG